MSKATWIGAGLVGGGALFAALAARGAWRRRPAVPPFLVMGDSLAVGVGAALARQTDGVTTRAQVGEPISTTADRLDSRLAGISSSTTVVLSTGTNSLGRLDANDIAGELALITNWIRALGNRVIILGPPPARAWGVSRRSPEWNESLWRLKVTYGRMQDYVDLWALLGDSLNAGYYAEEFGAPDGLHPNYEGYQEIARAVISGKR